jgi:hypothetical protein
MNLPPHDITRLRQLMDACRVGSDDVSLPEMADLAAALREDGALRTEWERRQRSDRVIAGAMHDVSAPAGLAERILAAAAARKSERLSDTVEQATAAAADPTAKAVPAAQPGWKPSRRRLWQSAAGLAAALVLGVAVWQFVFRSPESVSRAQLESSALAWFDAALEQTRSGEPATGSPPVPFPQQAVRGGKRSWRPLKNAEEPGMVVFDLTSRQLGGRVFLFAARTSKKYDVGAVPYSKLTGTRGLEIGAWQEAGVIYVLVVDTQNSGLHLKDVLSQPKLAFVPPRRY